MAKYLLGFICLCMSLAQGLSQKGSCGMSTQQQVDMDELFRQSGIDHSYMTKRGDKLYIPVKFHLVGDNNGNKRVNYNAVLGQLAKLNNDYAKHNFIFYLKDNYTFNLINSTNIQSNPRNYEFSMKDKKDTKAINIFVVETIGASGVGTGIVLGYYSTQNDFVVIMKKELETKTNTLSHELGHFFNLRHTFHGWESEPYDEIQHGNPCLLTIAPGSNIQVELVKRTNCTVASDQLCDTPPDYNFGLNAPACIFNKVIFDKNGDSIKPMINNQMSYFSDCATYQFTNDQETRMRTNYAAGARAYLRSNYVPKADTLPRTISLIHPPGPVAGQPQKIDVYNNIVFEWENIGADFYLLEIKQGSNVPITYFVEKANQKVITELKPNTFYSYAVYAFHQGYFDVATPIFAFRTGNVMTATKDQKEVNQRMNVIPNPMAEGQVTVALRSEVSSNGTLEIRDIAGRILHTQAIRITIGDNQYAFDASGLLQGSYIIQIKAEDRIYSKQIVK